jgi:hypothetical protein
MPSNIDTLKNYKGEIVKVTGIPHLDSALSYVGVTEEKNPELIAKWCKNVGVSSKAQWCAVFVSNMLDKGKTVLPKLRAALARRFVEKTSILAKDVVKGITKVPSGYMAIWQRGNTINGHIGFVLTEVSGAKSFQTVEGNTTPNRVKGKKPEYSGGAVEQKTRKIEPMAFFAIKWFSKVSYAK